MKPKIPQPLRLERKELQAELIRAIKAGGKTGERAKALAQVLSNHFAKEDEFALPPIGLMETLARGKADREIQSVLAMTNRLKAELPKMLREHKAMVSALKKFIAAAKKEKKPEHARFAERLMLHAKTEEKVLYPAAIWIGEYLTSTAGRERFEGYC